jgi:Restriction endonuclease
MTRDPRDQAKRAAKHAGIEAARQWSKNVPHQELLRFAGYEFTYRMTLDDLRARGLRVPPSRDPDFSWGFFKKAKSRVHHALYRADRAAVASGANATKLNWRNLDDGDFERLVFALISRTRGYENAAWPTQTRAPDKGRDLSVSRVIKDSLAGTIRQRVIIQCRHWLSRSIRLADASEAKDQMKLWSPPTVDVLVIATSGRFTSDAVMWIERHNAEGAAPRIEMWPESHLERLLIERPTLISEFGLR